MASVTPIQSNFSRGQIDPRVFARVDTEVYNKAAQLLRNCIVTPQGGITRRFGTRFVYQCTIATQASYFEIAPFVYDDDTEYLFLFEAEQITVFLENLVVATISTSYMQEDIASLRYTQVDDHMILTNEYFPPAQIVRSANSPVNITSFDGTNMYLTATTGLTVGNVYPVQFATSTSLPTTSPQIYVGRDYFIRVISSTEIRVYSTSGDAINNINFYTITSAGTGATVIPQNTWTLSNVVFGNVPAYDFGDFAYQTNTRQWTIGGTQIATTAVFNNNGTPVVIPNITAYVGGLLFGSGGVMRITGNSGSSTLTGSTIIPFDFEAGNASFLASESVLGEPAWSTARGWPRTVGFFQNRLVFGGSLSIPNGVWLSVSGSAYDFDDSEALDDYAISWYPAAGGINYVRAITSSRSLIIHTNTGNYSTPLTSELPVTPANFSLTEQNKDGIGTVTPCFIDNQIIYIDRSGNNAKSLIWDFLQSSWTLSNISFPSSNLIKQPVDLTAFSQPGEIDGNYIHIINGDGTQAVYQTLLNENMAAWTPQDTLQTYTPGYFVHVNSSLDRLWFGVQRAIATAQSPTIISGFSATNSTLTATAHGMPIGTPTYVQFTTSGTLPATTPQIVTGQYYWAVALDANTFKVYASESDAISSSNVFAIASAGTSSDIVPYFFETRFYIEELDYGLLSDSAYQNNAVNASTVAGLTWLEGETVGILADGYILPDQTVVGGTINLGATYQNVEIGLPFYTQITPLPVNIGLATGPNLYIPKHIRTFYVHFYNSYGGTINGWPLVYPVLGNVMLDTPPVPFTGILNFSPMTGWDLFDATDQIIVEQSDLLPLNILAFGYIVEVNV